MKKIILWGIFIISLASIGFYIGDYLVDREIQRVKRENEGLIKEKYDISVAHAKLYSERTRLWMEIGRLKRINQKG